MKTFLYYYTGTGNSLWAARRIAGALGDTDLSPLTVASAQPGAGADCLGLVFPVHMWGVPRPILEFLPRIVASSARYNFAVAVNAGQVARTLIQLSQVMEHHGLTLNSGFSVVLPSNYIPWVGAWAPERQRAVFAEAERGINTIVDVVKERRDRPVDRGPLWHRILFSALYRMAYPNVPRMDGDFWVDQNCNSCLLCERICPAHNIRMEEGKPLWLHRCEQCLACIQWCPEEAIQYGKKTPAYTRYRNAEVTARDMLIQSGAADRRS
jgi:ferredoxin